MMSIKRYGSSQRRAGGEPQPLLRHVLAPLIDSRIEMDCVAY